MIKEAFMGKNKLFLQVLIFSILLTGLPKKTLADYKFKDEIPVTLNLRSHWDYQDHRCRYKGSCSLQFFGTAKLAKQKDEEDDQFLRYVPEDMKAIYEFQSKSVVIDPEDECYGKIDSTMSAHGLIALLSGSPQENPLVNTGWFILDLSLGELGKYALNQQELAFFGKAWDPEKEPPTDNYHAYIAANVNMTYEYRGDGCDDFVTKKGLYPLLFYIDFKELDWCSMSGSYEYNGEPSQCAFVVVDLPGYKYFGPTGNRPEIPLKQATPQYNDERQQPQSSAAHTEVRWHFGEEPALPVSSTFLGDYPQNREPGWSEECQGVTHDRSHWFITESCGSSRCPMT
jgi:hypothetical protein